MLKIGKIENISAFAPGFLPGFISTCTACPLGKMPVSAVQLDKILPAEKGEKPKPNNHQMKLLLLCYAVEFR